jgi:pullulanase
MFEKLMIDTVVQNAIQYKIDGYRFDDMSLHFAYNMQHIKQALESFDSGERRRRRQEDLPLW